MLLRARGTILYLGNLNHTYPPHTRLRFTSVVPQASLFVVSRTILPNFGIDVHLHCDANNLLDPISALQTNISRTVTQHPNPVASFFRTLKPPFRAFRTSTMAKVIEEAIRSVGLGNQGLSAKDFRRTGATAAIDSGLHPDIAMKTGQLKKARHFCYHYVHSKPPEEYTHDYLFHE